MSSSRPFQELLLGEAYEPHPGNVNLPLGVRFRGKRLLIVGGGGSQTGWTQAATFTKSGALQLGPRSERIRKMGDGWLSHLKAQRAEVSSQAVLLMEQWQAALGGAAINRTLPVIDQLRYVRENGDEFGAEKLHADLIRAAIDHPTMNASVVFGAKSQTIAACLKEFAAAGLSAVSVRIPTMALLEVYFNDLRTKNQAPAKPIIATDGSTACIVNVVQGAFDTGDGGLSTSVARPDDQASFAYSRLSRGGQGTIAAHVIGAPLGGEAPALIVEHIPMDPAEASLHPGVTHDFILDLEDVRPQVPRFVQPLVFAALALVLIGILFGGYFLFDGIRVSSNIAALDETISGLDATIRQQGSTIQTLDSEMNRAKVIGEWVSKNYRAQRLLVGVLRAMPRDVLINSIDIQMAEGASQGVFVFQLSGEEEQQRTALRAIEQCLYRQNIEIGKREDPVLAAASKGPKGAVQYSWSLIMPSFGQ